MSISPAQMNLTVATGESLVPSRRSSPAPSASVAAPAAAAESAPSPSAPAPAPSNPVTTDLRIDSQHQFYYEFVDASTGSVEFEIPPEALRAIGESLNLPLQGDTANSNFDVKS
jgi:hypothetical protein